MLRLAATTMSNPQNLKIMDKDPIINEVDVFSLFSALKRDGHARLSDHFVNKKKEE